MVGLALFAVFLSVAPSLSIVLSYADHKVQPINPVSFHSRAKIRTRKNVAFRFQPRATAERTRRSIAVPSLDATPLARVEHSAEAAKNPPHESDTLLSGDPIPTLKQRSSLTDARSARPAQSTIILISNEPSSRPGSPAVTKGRAVASAVLAGAGEAARIAAQGHGREAH